MLTDVPHTGKAGSITLGEDLSVLAAFTPLIQHPPLFFGIVDGGV